MTTDEQERDEQLRQLVHDIHHCLHVIGMGAELLKDARNEDRKFADVSASIDKERKEASRLVDELLNAARQVSIRDGPVVQSVRPA